MDLATYKILKETIENSDHNKNLEWAKSIIVCTDPVKFGMEAAYVIVNSGMKYRVAQGIWGKILKAIISNKVFKNNHEMVLSAFKHPGKSKAIAGIFDRMDEMFADYQILKTTKAKLDYLESISWIGPITKYHLAKNLGLDCIKPDRHLVRIADHYEIDCFKMCEDLKKASGDKLAVIDSVLWGAAELGFAYDIIKNN